MPGMDFGSYYDTQGANNLLGQLIQAKSQGGPWTTFVQGLSGTQGQGGQPGQQGLIGQLVQQSQQKNALNQLLQGLGPGNQGTPNPLNQAITGGNTASGIGGPLGMLGSQAPSMMSQDPLGILGG